MKKDTSSDRDRWAAVARILDGAFECRPGALDAFLEEACGGDAGLRREVEALLGAQERAPAFLDGDVVEFAAPAFDGPADPEPELCHVGPYRLVREVGRGGMGTVYLAERADGAFAHTVAIKVIRTDLDAGAVERRFRYERQILAQLRHPNIARLFDGGATPDGVLYFVMEYVEGRTLLEHCAGRRAGLDERLKLFGAACEAVQHAHHNLVVHRDLKPSNVLVTPEGEVKLLDFGIAKLLDEGARSEPGPATRLGLQPMTPEYASPEQLRGDAITTASDVYSLGVVLYELLTGSAPYPTDRRSAAELERIVSERIPVRPSEALRRRRPAADGGDPGVPQVPRDLDAIVMKALKKEPHERYPSATDLLLDVRRYLGGFPVAARDDSTRYRAMKFVSRNRVAVGFSGLALLSLLGGLVGTSFQAHVAARERDARRLEAERARATADFAVGLFDMVDPTQAQGRTVTVQDLVAAGDLRVSELAGQPTQQAMFMDVMGRVSAAIGLFEKADSLFSEAVALKETRLGASDPGVAESLLGLGGSLLMQNRLDEAEEALDRAQAIQLAAFGATDPRTLRAQNALGFAYHTLGDRARAESLLRRVVERGSEPELREHPEIVEARYNLARVLDYYGEHAEAEGILREVLWRREAALGPDHSQSADAAFALARNLASQGELEEAAALYQRAHDVYERVYGADNVYTAMSVYGRAQVQHRGGDLRGAAQGYRAAAAIYRTQSSSGEWEAYARVALGQVLVALGQPHDAEREIARGLELYQAAPVVDGEQVAVARSWLGRALSEQGRYAEAEATLLLARDSLSGRPHLARQADDALRHLVELYRAWNRPDEALVLEASRSESDREPGG
jgi:eukaryotic-like serine/threonine-protein kinase